MIFLHDVIVGFGLIAQGPIFPYHAKRSFLANHIKFWKRMRLIKLKHFNLLSFAQEYDYILEKTEEERRGGNEKEEISLGTSGMRYA